jgi:adenylate cyclase
VILLATRQPISSRGVSRRAAADLALTMLSVVETAGPPWRIRIGIHNGPVVAGDIGTSKVVYDLWGAAVNVASRLEAS